MLHVPLYLLIFVRFLTLFRASLFGIPVLFSEILYIQLQRTFLYVVANLPPCAFASDIEYVSFSYPAQVCLDAFCNIY